MTSVEPVETRSTIASARPSRGATSTAPEIGHDVDRDAPLVEEPAGGVRMGGRDPQTGQVLDGPVRRVGGDRGRQAAATVAEVADTRQFGARLAQQVDAGDPQVGDAVPDELDDVVGPDEQDVEVVVLDARDQAPVVLVEDEARVVEQAQGRFDEAALVRDGQAEALGHSRLVCRRSLSSIAR